MSLFVNDPRTRGKSPGRRDRSRSRGRTPSPPRPVQPRKSKKYYEEEDSDESSESDRNRDHRSSRYHREDVRYEVAEPKHRRASSPVLHSTALTQREDYVASPDRQYNHDYHDGRHPSYAEPPRFEHERPTEYTRHSSYSRPDEHSHVTATVAPSYAPPGSYKWEYDHVEEKSHRPPPEHQPEQHRHMSFNSSGSFNINLGGGHQQQPQQAQYQQPQNPQYAQPPPAQYAKPVSPGYEQPQYGYAQPPPEARPDYQRHHSNPSASATIISGRQQYAAPERYQYAEVPQHITYTEKTDGRLPYTQTPQAQIIELKPANNVLHPHSSSSSDVNSRMHRLSVSGGAGASLSVGGPSHNNHHGGLPPGSPLLEAYHGTYQSISPMPSPMMLSSKLDDDLSDLEPLDGQYSSDDGRHRKPPKSILKKRVSIYDPEPDALALASALKHSKPDTEPIVHILPLLSDDHVMALRTEYKKHIKVGGKGINVAKHIKMKVPGNLGKIAYATALGRWESEAHWANLWYQSGTSRRELLIESLMGRPNAEIRAIKEAFSDKRYSDSLEKCMQTELKKDKFRYAVLLALEENRMDETHPLSNEKIRRDVHDLYKALTAKEGGETAMIDIIVVRSDRHLQEVLRSFEATYKKNFAREMIMKSKNLVVSIPMSLLLSSIAFLTPPLPSQGETLAHILNGVLNRPVRDAMLLRQALAETSKDRTELLISRLVRFHWEPKHFEKVRVEYRRKYGVRIEVDVEEGTKGEFGEFCERLLRGGER